MARPAPGSERILVCVSDRPACADLVRYADGLARRLQAKWTALYVESLQHARLDESGRNRIAECLLLAEKLGGDAVTIPGDRIAQEILAYVRENAVTQIVIGKSARSRWFRMLHGVVMHDVVEGAGRIVVHVLAEAGSEAMASNPPATRSSTRALNPLHWLLIAGVIAIVTLFGVATRSITDAASMALLYVTVVLITATCFDLVASLWASVLAVVCFDFFFTVPYYHFYIEGWKDTIAFCVFVIVAFVTSGLASRMRSQVQMARNRARITAELYSFSRKLTGIADLGDLLWATSYQIASMLHAKIVILLGERDRLALRAAYPPEDRLNKRDVATATWVWRNSRSGGHGGEIEFETNWLFLPLRTARNTLGVLGIMPNRTGALLAPDERRLLDALADQAVVAIERIELAAEIDEARVIHETERLRTALLTSISHDLRTPLASILAAIAFLRREGGDRESREEVLDTAQEETERLNRFVGNLLDITRLESGILEVTLGLVDLDEVIPSAVRRARAVLGKREVKIDLAPDLPALRLDDVLFEQVVFNLLDNAAKYSPASGTVSITARVSGKAVILQIADEGTGIPPDDIERIFDKFYRVNAGDRQRAGTGLGLVICRGFIEAQGGAIVAGNRTDRSGAIFTITLPIPESEALAFPG